MQEVWQHNISKRQSGGLRHIFRHIITVASKNVREDQDDWSDPLRGLGFCTG